MLTVIVGPMMAGKSSMLISKAEQHIIAGQKVVAFKPSIDNRYGSGITTHNGKSFDCYSVPIKCEEKCDSIIYDLLKAKVDVVIFDEAQFFDKIDIVEVISDYMSWAHVIISGLKDDCKGNAFGAMPQLMVMADDIIFLKGVCANCKKINSATRTYRKISSDEQVIVGGDDLYEARCHECWM